MSLSNEQLERLITRSLDGEISAADRAILNAELDADPQARRLFDDYRRLDGAAHAALQTVADAPRIIQLPRRPQRPNRRMTWLAAVPAVLAAAAAVVFFIAPRGSEPKPTDAPQVVSIGKPPLKNLVPHDPANSALQTPAWAGQADPGAQFVDYVDQPSLQPRRLNRHLTRDWIGVMDETGRNIYLMQNNHRRTRIVPVSGDF